MFYNRRTKSGSCQVSLGCFLKFREAGESKEAFVEYLFKPNRQSSVCSLRGARKHLRNILILKKIKAVSGELCLCSAAKDTRLSLGARSSTEPHLQSTSAQRASSDSNPQHGQS